MSEVNFEDVARELNIMFARKPRTGQKRNIVFWFNGDGKFQDKLDELTLDNAKIIVSDGTDSFNLKYKLEVEDIDSNYLIYVPKFKPKAEDNYLLDIYMYSQEFEADVATIYMREIGIKNTGLFETVRKHEAFFANQKRILELKNLVLRIGMSNLSILAFCARL